MKIQYDEINDLYCFTRLGTLTGREGCVIESALKFNKHRVVWVLLAGANSSRLKHSIYFLIKQ